MVPQAHDPSRLKSRAVKGTTSVRGVLLAVCALIVIAIGWGEFYSPAVQGRFPIRVSDDGRGPHVSAIRPHADISGIAIGDPIDLASLSRGERLRLQLSSSIGSTLVVRIRHAGRWSSHTLTAIPRTINPWSIITELFTLTIGELIVGMIALRRPSIATAALIFAASNPITSAGAAAQFSWLPDPLFTIVGAAVLIAFTSWPSTAVIPFITRFPRSEHTRSGRVAMGIGDGVFWSCGAFSLVEIIWEPVLLNTWSVLDNAVTIVVAVLCWAFALHAILRVRGEDRRRIGWVIAGYGVAALAALTFNLLDAGVLKTTTATAIVSVALNLSTALQIAFPIALAYAVLRHRVLDLGFVVNRGLVYTLVTATVVVVVSFIDWLSGRLIGETRLALAAEAAVTVTLGVALSRIHARVETIVERIFFHKRHIAERKLDRAIAALAFATTQAAIDTVVTGEAAAVLGLRSAAIFRLSEDGSFTAVQTARGLPLPAPLDENSVLVRTMRAEERVVFIADLPTDLEALGTDFDAPMLAIPIVTRHTLVGLALYGPLDDGTALDPELTDLLARLCAASGFASTAVQAAQSQAQISEITNRLHATEQQLATLRQFEQAL
jgi:hypothetical protein